MECLTLILAEIGIISIVAFVLNRVHRIAYNYDEFCLIIKMW